MLSGGGESPLWAVLFSRGCEPGHPPQGPSPARLGARWGSRSGCTGPILERLAFSEPGRWDDSKYGVLSKKISKTKKFFFWTCFFICKKKFFSRYDDWSLRKNKEILDFQSWLVGGRENPRILHENQ